ncbi:MAG: hypothetical protein FD130_1854, partial [Halothiobacillaceae bacterium]
MDNTVYTRINTILDHILAGGAMSGEEGRWMIAL